MLASRPIVSIRLDLPEPLIPIRTFSGRSSSGSADSPNDRRLHTEIRSIGMGIRSRALFVGGRKWSATEFYRRSQHTRTERLRMQGRIWNGCNGWCSGLVPAVATGRAWLEFGVARIARYRREGEASRMEITFTPGLLGCAFLRFAFGLLADRAGIARCRSLQIHCQEGGQDLLVCHRGVPAVGVENRPIKGLVGIVQPGRGLVVEIRQGPLGQVEDVGVLRDQTRVAHGPDSSVIGVLDVTSPRPIDRAREFQNFLSNPFWRVQPVTSKVIKSFGRLCDCVSLGLDWHRERKGLEATRGCVPESAFALPYLGPLRSSPYLMRAGLKDAHKIIIGAGKDNQLVVGQGRFLGPSKEPVLGHRGRGDETRQLPESVSHRGTGLDVNPPTIPVNLTLVLLSLGPNILLNECEWFLIASGFAHRQIDAEINDPDVSIATGEVESVDPGRDDGAIGSPMRVGSV